MDEVVNKLMKQNNIKPNFTEDELKASSNPQPVPSQQASRPQGVQDAQQQVAKPQQQAVRPVQQTQEHIQTQSNVSTPAQSHQKPQE
jgi:hypothetical protein